MKEDEYRVEMGIAGDDDTIEFWGDDGIEFFVRVNYDQSEDVEALINEAGVDSPVLIAKAKDLHAWVRAQG
ncbi:hypothetical protein J7426_01535 [Tropicibacter sp. R16_0]|uniref:hypothetical protein n=1 Tax=Tropicibacter sp. R16_0 TaxID=2821102 RepID=UPI001AD9962B|nr:hypothetical protein [Tropicibacter sp. R16_0]MBO9448919.1 hypothetical protein [Tropicibacter sp. R16_0]